jgi:hypothetical protein
VPETDTESLKYNVRNFLSSIGQQVDVGDA